MGPASSILHPLPLSVANTPNNDSNEPALKKRKLNDNDSIATSESNSNNKSLNSSSETKSNSKKRKQMDVDTGSSSNSDNQSKHKKSAFSSHSIKKLFKADQTLKDLQITGDAIKIIAHATQCFMDDVLKESISNAKASKNDELEYDHIANYIDSKDNLAFLSDIIPKRVDFSKAMKTSNDINKEKESSTPSNDSNTNNKMEEDA